jgi:hypothetical protein
MLFTEANLKNFKITINGNFYNTVNNNTFYYHYACKECGHPFLNRRKGKDFCNIKCVHINNTGNKYPEHSLRMQKNNPMRRPEIRLITSKRMTGSSNPNWINGKSCEPYCIVWSDREWKYYLKYTRDGGKCWSPYCNGKYINKLTLHHINYNKKNCNDENLITLCCSCNGKANIDRDWHESWYGLLMKKRGY